MASVAELEELGRKVMECSVTAEYLELPNVVSYLDTVFAELVGRVVDARRRLAAAVALEPMTAVGGSEDMHSSSVFGVGGEEKESVEGL